MIFIAMIVIGAFFYSNYVIPMAQKRMWTLVYSFKDKALEIEIPVGEFYTGIRGVNIYARGRDTDKKAMTNVMIYDFTKGFQSASVTAADTVRISTTEDKKYLKIDMKNGECFENVQQQQVGSNTIPYRRESFKQKELLFEFDTGFKELDENMMANQHISKNIERLIKDIDSVSVIRDSLKAGYTKKLLTINHILPKDSTVALDIQPTKTAKVSAENIDSMFASAPQKQMVQIASEAARNIENTMSDVRYYTIIINEIHFVVCLPYIFLYRSSSRSHHRQRRTGIACRNIHHSLYHILHHKHYGAKDGSRRYLGSMAGNVVFVSNTTADRRIHNI